MGSQIVGVLSAAALGNTDASTLQQTAWITNNATQFNFAGHQELDDFENSARTCESKGSCEKIKKDIRNQSVADDDALASLCKISPEQCVQYYGDLLHDRYSLQERLAHMYFDDSIPSMFKEDLHRLQLQNNSAITTLTQAQSQLDLINRGVSPEKAGWLSDLLAVMGGMLGGGKGGGKLTSTVWDKVKPTDPSLRGTSIPKSFEISTDGGSFWVHPNATKHMEEFLTRNGLSHSSSLASQAMLSSFQIALNNAAAQGIKYGEVMQVGRWELIISAGRPGEPLPVVKHALYK